VIIATAITGIAGEAVIEIRKDGVAKLNTPRLKFSSHWILLLRRWVPPDS
jgi:hypothetical protein